jgi:hypothetical protein
MLLLVARIILFKYAGAFATGDGTIRPWQPDVLLAFYLVLQVLGACFSGAAFAVG